MKIEQIKKMVEFKFETKLTTKNRSRNIVYARAVYFKLCRKYTTLTLNKIGKTVGKDHATVLHGIRLYDEQVTRYSPYHKNVYRAIDRKLSGEKDIENAVFRNEMQEVKSTIKELTDKLKHLEREFAD